MKTIVVRSFVLILFILISSNLAISAQLKVTVEGMTCGSCVKKLSAHIRQKPGVIEASVDLEKKLLSMTTSAPAPTNEVVTSWVSELGYTVTAVVLDAENSQIKTQASEATKK